MLEMRKKLKILKEIAFNRREIRNNTEMFDKNEVVFELDNKSMPINIGIRSRIETEKIVEEFMIMANS